MDAFSLQQTAETIAARLNEKYAAPIRSEEARDAEMAAYKRERRLKNIRRYLKERAGR